MMNYFFLQLLVIIAIPTACCFSPATSLLHNNNNNQAPLPPKAFVKQVIVPWFHRARTLFPQDDEEEEEEKDCENDYTTSTTIHTEPSSSCEEIPPVFEQAAQRYQRELGIPPLFFREWVSFMLQNDEDGDLYYKELAQISTWGIDNERVCIDGGDVFDWKELYRRLVQKRIQETKERILTTIESSVLLSLPVELESIPRDELLNSHDYDDIFQTSLAAMLDSSKYPWEIRNQLHISKTDWFVSMRCIRTEYYFPRELWKNHSMCKDLERIFYFEGLFDLSTSSYCAVQKHLVQHLDEWRRHIDFIPRLYNDIAVPLLSRDRYDFLSKGAAEMSPKALLYHEREAILDLPFAGVNDLPDTPRVRVLRSARDVQDIATALNTEIFAYDDGSLAIPAWGGGKEIAIALCNPHGVPIAAGVFTFAGYSRGDRTAQLGCGSSVTIGMPNDDKRDIIDASLVSLCKHFHDDFLYGWRVEKLEEENPEWYRRKQQG